MPPAFAYIYYNNGIDSEESYPYEAADATCNYNVDNNVTTVKGYGLIQPGNLNSFRYFLKEKYI